MPPHRRDSSTWPAPLAPLTPHSSQVHGPATAATQVGTHPPAQAAHFAGPTGSPLSVPLGALTLMFVTGSVVVAALLGFGLAAWLEPVSPWMVGLASAVGVLCTALPLGLALLGLARKGAAPLPEGASASAFAARPAPAPAAPAAMVPASPALRPALPEASGSNVQTPGVATSREHFMDIVAREWSRARRYGTGAALLLLEIDRYARLTDALGDVAGEKVLAELLAATAPSLRGADALARYEAGRIAVFLAHADATGALDVAERIRERAEQMETVVAPRRVRFTVSVGVAQLRPAHLHLHTLVDDVQDALTTARAAGGNCVRAAPVDRGQRPAPPAARDGSRADKG